MRIPGLRSIGSLCFAGLLLGTQLAACADTGTQDIWMSPDADGSRRRSEFVSDSEQINIIIQYSTGRRDLTIRAEVFPVELDPDTKFKTFTSGDALQVLGQAGTGTIQAFTLIRAEGDALPPRTDTQEPDVVEGDFIEPWPLGVFRARVLFDNDEVGLIGFKISQAPCPNFPPIPLSPCRQFKRDEKCIYNAESAFPIECACQAPIQEYKWICNDIAVSPPT